MHSGQRVRQRRTERALTSRHHDVVQRLCPWVRPRSNCRTDAQTGFTCCSLTLACSRSDTFPSLPCVVINSFFPPKQSLNRVLCFLIFSIEANYIHQRTHQPAVTNKRVGSSGRTTKCVFYIHVSPSESEQSIHFKFYFSFKGQIY